mmetsp:Transcript_66406/g.121251  ORF Transcript_66406/g.121251 Transcript_66406/m.121251 type:complete len:176 (+) Transcript_66406:2-529(+)
MDVVYYGKLESKENGITHSGDNLTGEGEGDDEQIRAELNRIGPNIFQVFFIVNIYTPNKTFRRVANPYCRVVDELNNSEMCRFALRENAGTSNGLIISKIKREIGGRWGFHALGIPCTGRTFKDSMGALQQACKVETQGLRDSRQGIAGDLGPRQVSETGMPGGRSAQQECCIVS